MNERAPGPTVTASPEVVAQAVRGLFRRDSAYMVLWAGQLLGAAAVTPVITRLISAAEFGRVATANAIMQVIFVIAGMGLQTAIQRRFAEGGLAEARRLLTLTVFAALLIAALVELAGPLWITALGLNEYRGAVRLAVVWACLSAVTGSALGLLRSQDRLLSFTAVSLLQSVIAEVGSLLLVATVQPTAQTFVAGQVIAQALATVVALLLAPPSRLRVSDKDLVRCTLSYALPLVPAVLCTFILDTSDRLIVGNILGSEAVAKYQIAYNVGSMPMLLLGVLNSAWMPRLFALADGPERVAVLVASRNALYRLIAPIVMGLSLGAPLVLRLWAPSAYEPDRLVMVTAIVVVSVIPFAATLSVTRTLLAAGRTRAIGCANTIAAAANIGLNLILVPHGIEGAAVATLISYCILLAVLHIGTRRTVPTGSGWVAACSMRLPIAVLVAFAAVWLPTSTVILAVRAVLALACVGWFAMLVLHVVKVREA